ncbi:hypothetical protein Trydic_g11295 [Trypoxylus dichotomus]
MGCTPSRRAQHRGHGVSDSRNSYDSQDNDSLEVFTVDKYDQKVITQLKRDFKENMDMFLLNNILMSVMFFENYDLEITQARRIIPPGGQEMSIKLISDHNKICIMPDTVIEMVNRKVSFQHRHGKMKNVKQCLAMQRMYVIYDTMEILRENEDLDHYSGIDKPTERAHVENSKHHGFVKLRHPEYRTSPNGSISTSSNSTYASNGVLTPPLELNDNAPSTSSGRYSMSIPDESEYTHINEMKTLLPLSQTRSSSNSSGASIYCLKSIKSRNLQPVDETDDLYIIRNYYDSTEFMKHFTSHVFPGGLAESLGFDQMAISEASHNARAIYCNIEQDRGCSIKCEIVPAVLNPWPGLNAWAARDRPIVVDKRNMVAYRWPTPQMVQDMLKCPAVLVPRGFIPKRGQNADYNLEWEVSFPKAEKYMHTRMSHAQMKCYLFMAILHKTFIEPVTQQKGLLFDHIRTLIYWECENNYRDWPENRLGEKMILLLQLLKNAMGKVMLKDYFIESKNIFENIPGCYLFSAQEKIHNICQRPVGHFINALRNLEYSSGRFYPMLNFDKLYEILSAQESISLVVNHMVLLQHTNRSNRIVTHNAEQNWMQRKIEQNFEKKRMQSELEQNLQGEEARPSVNSINLNWTGKGNTKVDSTKAGEFMKFFAEHFIAIADKSMKYYGAMTQALFYLKQAWYLTKVMEDPIVGAELYARDLQSKIYTLETLCRESANDETFTPTTPARNSSIMQIHHQVVNGVTVDLNNVTQNFARTYPNLQPNEARRRNTKNVRINSMVERL